MFLWILAYLFLGGVLYAILNRVRSHPLAHTVHLVATFTYLIPLVAAAVATGTLLFVGFNAATWALELALGRPKL